MARFTSASLAAVLTLSPAVRAWSDIHIARRVQADTATPVSVDVNSDAVGYRIYLATTPPGWGTGPVCWLVNYTDSSVTSVDVTIPASVVPDGTSVSLSYSGLQYSDEYGYEGSSYDYSNDFGLEGGTGEWSALELGGSDITSPDNTPCTALQCTRDCANTYYPDGTINYPENEDELTNDFLVTYKSYYNCLAACPGNDYPPYEEIMGGDDGDDDGDDDDDDDDDDDIYATASVSSYSSATYYETASGIASASTSTTASATASATTGSLTTQTTASKAKATGASLSSTASETASGASASSAASSAASTPSTVTASSAGRAGLAGTAVLVCCIAMLLGI
ncbi:hypothetical protein SLS53_006104 [Cytospora paraplurivora]|uniref:Uncharacterized protein n=1 Tax=Cytospora paraplurivora TaxID=2898453 RepID=A0AAN9YF83_9PEZI